jgi:hypothetical protein
MPADPAADGLDDLRGALRTAAPGPAGPVDPHAVLARSVALARRRTAGRALLVLLVLLPLAGVVAALTRSGQVDLAEGGGSIPATLAATEEPPAVLADGSAPAEVPAAIRARFDAPVVGTRRADAAPPGLSDACAAPAGPLAVGPGAGRLPRLADATGPALVHLGPEVASLLRTGVAAAPPGYPDAYSLTCIARPDPAGRLATEGAALQHLYAGWTGYDPPTDGAAAEGAPAVWVSAIAVPPGAAYAVQEQPGWWLAYDVTGAAWMLAQSTRAIPDGSAIEDVGFPGGRIVFLAADGTELGEERLGREAIRADAPFLASQATAARIRLGAEAVLRAELADGPVPACAEERTACVWVVDVDGELLALSAAGPRPSAVPPFGEVGWCAAEGRFAESTSSVRYGPDGSPGPLAPIGLNRYAVVVTDGEVTVDLAQFSFGPQRDPADASDSAAPPPPCAELAPAGFPLP